MNKILKRAFMPSLLAASLAGVSLFPAQPASADDKILEDVGIGAGVGAVSGVIRGRNVIRGAIKGAGAGAAVNGANGLRGTRRERQNRNIIQDVGVGAAAGAVTDGIINGGGDTLGSAAEGAATGAVINTIRKKR
ncbi:hypothetical protein SAMD00079811_46180 [Scytonema sp. HK-05]|uniref:hypothetical protein n=1 Tax=Scytonema sp. HK-05 TaxID=1137095 RepID=UPI000936E13F|nr:hypothetical protein [Scytonema sp. HK-05]OKH58520.1 hypothetical protein NIES2130_13640 [Scytonema sp. HK-05]BAY47002.1 hypothetical protein SAMD00079811_46180 [Scytonema sp. HK-05]